MEAKEFKRAAFLTLSPRTAKEGFKTVTKKRRDINLVAELLATQSAVGQLQRDSIPYITPGVQLNDTLRNQLKDDLGAVLQHGVNVAKLLKVKVPSSKKKIKARTPTLMLMEVARTAGEMFDTYVAAVSGAKVVPMNDEEKAAAQKKYDEAEAKRKAKFDAAPASTKNDKGEDVPKGEYKPGKLPDFTKVVAAPLNEELLKSQVEHFLKAVYELAWAVFTKGDKLPEVSPVATAMADRISKLAPQYPEGFFTPPPKKPAPAGLKPPTKKKKEEAPAEEPKAAQA